MQTGADACESLAHTLARDGFSIVEDVVPRSMIESLKQAIEDLGEREEVRRKGGTYGVRNLFDVVPLCRELAVSTELRDVVEPVLGRPAWAIRAALFDKIPGANWKLFWHQDTAIAVREPRAVEGYGKFVKKAGVWHVQPPVAVLEGMLAVRVHLDDCGVDNGPLRVLAGSHRFGRYDDPSPETRSGLQEVVCTVCAGGVVLMRPLLLHASSAAAAPRHRRVIHIEYASQPLPGGLQWHERLHFRKSAGSRDN
jgi:ectoine hydroxylase-related dioxygenase (phytanoyl-CoA dioxygenase family)